MVTGGSRGIGRAIVEALAREGAWVAVGCRRRESDAEATLAAVKAAGGDGAVRAFDVRDAAAVDRAVDGMLVTRGRINVLVNCAGVARDAPFATCSLEEWDEVLRTNLDGTMLVTRSLVRSMMSAGGGSVINVASIAGLRASPGQASYAASKGALLALTTTLAAELGPRGIRVNALVPGLIATGMVTRTDPRVLASKVERIPLGRMGEAREVAMAAVFLASDESSYVTGAALVIDGGLSL